MNLRRIAILTCVLFWPVSICFPQSSQWLHVRVLEGPEKTVKVNVPLSLVETVLPLIDEADFEAGKIRLEDQELEVADLRKIWEAAKQQGDYELASVNEGGTRVRVSIEGNTLFVRSMEGSEQELLVMVPGSVVDALLSGEGNELDVQAAVSALAASGGGELVQVQDGAKSVRVWIDSSSTGD